MAEEIFKDFLIYYLSERAVTIQFGDIISDELSARVSNFNQMLINSPFPGLISTVPAYNTLSVFFNPLTVYKDNSLKGADCFEKVFGYLNELSALKQEVSQQNSNTMVIPVCYEASFGPDLNELADLHQLDPLDIIRLHSEAKYKVSMIGFVPGFAYLTGLNDKLESPRRQSPRKAVPAGSVGIAGMQTGIYSLQTPGGWQIIGRTPLIMFDALRPQPSLLKNGDTVVFKPISIDEFEILSKKPNAHTHS